jgi:hypothetical protein
MGKQGADLLPLGKPINMKKFFKLPVKLLPKITQMNQSP